MQTAKSIPFALYLNSMKQRVLYVAILLVVVVGVVACTAGPNPNQPVQQTEPAGFLLGLWHGFISLFAFFVSLFSDQVGVYEVYNNGNWYNFGFVLGAMMFYGGGGGASRSGRK